MACIEFEIKSVMKSESFNLEIDNDFSFLDLLKLLDAVQLGGYTGYRFKGEWINTTYLNKKIMDHVDNKKFTLRKFCSLTPKNSLFQLQNILLLNKHNLEETVNLYDVCPINHAKIGEWIGFGRGPIKVPKIEDNWEFKNLMFIIYLDSKPYVYNKHCLFLSIDKDNNTLLIPHINKRIDAFKFHSAYLLNSEVNIVQINEDDIIY